MPIVDDRFDFGRIRATNAILGWPVNVLPPAVAQLLCDPQTSGGLLVAVTPDGEAECLRVAAEAGMTLDPIGERVARGAHTVEAR